MPDTIGEAWVAIRPETSEFSGMLTNDLGPALSGLSNILGTTEFAPFLAGVAGVGAAATLAASTVIGFQQSLADLQAISGLTADGAKAVGDAFLTTAGQVTFSAQEMLQAFTPVSAQLNLLARRAMTADEDLKFMRVAMNLAEASGSDLKSTTAALTDVMVAFHLSLSDASNAGDILYNTSRVTGIEVESLATSIDTLHRKLGIASPSLVETATLMVDLSESGVTGSRAVLAVSNAMSTLLSGTPAVTAELKKLGVEVFDAGGNFVGMKSVLTQVSTSLVGMTEQQRLATLTVIFGKGAAEAMNLVLTDAVTKYDAATKATANYGSAADSAAIKTNTFGGEVSKVGAWIKDNFTGILDNATQRMSDNSWMFQHWGQSFADAGHWVVTTLQNFGSVVASQFNAVLDVAAAFPGQLWDDIKGAGNILYGVGQAIIGGLWNGMKAAWNAVTGWIGGIGDWIKQHKGPMSVDQQLLVPAGQAIMAGLHAGLKSGIPAIQGTLGGLTMSVGAMGGGGSRASGGGGIGGPTIIQNYHVGSDNQAIVEAAVRKGNRELISALQAGRR